MNRRKKLDYYWLLWIGLTFIAITGLATLFALSKQPPQTNHVTVRMNSYGEAQVGGVPLMTTNIRDAAFAGIAAAGRKAEFVVPSTLTNQTQVSNLINNLESMRRAGLFSTNQSTNHYE